MKLIFKAKFEKQYARLSLRQRAKVDKAMRFFEEDPFAPQLKNHALLGDFRGYRSISAAFDLRIMFQEENGYTAVLMISVGTHAQVYGS